VATVPRGWKVRTVTQRTGHQVRVAYPPGPRRKGAGRLISILHPQGENPGACREGGRLKAEGSNPRGKVKTREQVEKMQAKAVKFLRDVVKDDDKADEIEALSLDDYAAKKKITLGNPQEKPIRTQDYLGEKRFGKPVVGKIYLHKGNRVRLEEIGRDGKVFVFRPEDQKSYWTDFHILTAANPRERTGAWQDVEFRGIPKAARLPGGSLRGMPPSKKRKPKKPRNPKRRRRNQAQDAKALYQKFHGKAPKEVLELQESAAMRGEYASLGELVELVVKSPAGDSLRIGFEGEKVKLASSPNGGQLYFLGGNQALDGTLSRFKTDATKDLVDLGEAQSIVYRAAKDFTGFKSSDWEHAFGEESGERPSAFYDKLKRRIFLVGGTYRVERPGIVD
jgi:hypothetical protein